jgi:hypothetical protein
MSKATAASSAATDTVFKVVEIWAAFRIPLILMHGNFMAVRSLCLTGFFDYRLSSGDAPSVDTRSFRSAE